jgi:hypothetical protein
LRRNNPPEYECPDTSDNTLCTFLPFISLQCDTQANFTIDQCLALPWEQRRCGLKSDYNILTAFFCGHEAPCDCVGPGSRPMAPANHTFADEQRWAWMTGKVARCTEADRKAALRRAITNIARHYRVVGVSPLLHEFLEVVECRLPALRGLAAFHVPRVRVTTGGYPTPSPAAQAELARMLAYDIALYKQIVIHFGRQYLRCFPHRQPLTFPS